MNKFESHPEDHSGTEPIMPFGDLDLAEITAPLSTTGRFGRWISRSHADWVAYTIRDLWITGANLASDLAKMSVEKGVALRDLKKAVKAESAALDTVYTLRSEARKAKSVETRMDIAFGELGRKAAAAIIMSPMQFRKFSDDGYRMSENKLMAASGVRYSYSYNSIPIFTLEGFIGPAVVDAHTFACMKAALPLREM
jgi:hypothetical protein